MVINDFNIEGTALIPEEADRESQMDYGKTPMLDQQPWILWMVRLANAAEYHGKSLEFLLYTGELVWGGQSEFWPADIPAAFNKTGLDYDEIIDDIRKDPEKYDALWIASQTMAQESGHGGVPNMPRTGRRISSRKL